MSQWNTRGCSDCTSHSSQDFVMIFLLQRIIFSLEFLSVGLIELLYSSDMADSSRTRDETHLVNVFIRESNGKFKAGQIPLTMCEVLAK